jgi:hypothetical protein
MNRIHNPWQKKVDISNLPNEVKQMIMDQSIQKLHHYQPQKVQTRCESRYSIIDTKQFLLQKKKRLEQVYQCGFLSDPKELYKPLYEPQVDTELLLYDTLELDTKKLFDQNNHELEAHREHQQQKKQQQKIRMKMRQVPKRTTNGFKYIKEKLKDSNDRILGVKFGINFQDTCEDDHREHTYDSMETPQEQKTIDWNHLEIDEDRKTFFMNTYNKFIESQKPEESRAVVVTPQHQQKKKREVTKQKYSSKQIEQTLGIVREDQTVENTDKFFTTRDDFYEQRSRLNYRLQEELDRLDHERKSTFQRKVKVFEISKVSYIDSRRDSA